MKAGDTFRQADSNPGFDAKRHLWVVLSDPTAFPDEIITVFFTTMKARCDQTCIVDPGDHPFVVSKTTVAYSQAAIRKNSDLEALVAKGKLIRHDEAAPKLVQRIRMLLEHSPYSLPMIIAAAKRQGFDRPFPA